MLRSLFGKPTPTVSETPFSDFIRNASSREKKRVYTEVLKKATDRQVRVIEEVCRERRSSEHAGADGAKKDE